MGLTWKDVVSTVFMGAIAAVYAAFLGGTSAWLISSARGTTLAVFVLGMVGGSDASPPAFPRARGHVRRGWRPARGHQGPWPLLAASSAVTYPARS